MLVNNDRVLMESKTFRLNYTARTSEAHKFLIVTDALLRKDLAKFCAMNSRYGKDSVLLGALAYNCGPGVVNKSTVLKKLKAGTSTSSSPTSPTAATKARNIKAYTPAA